MPRLYHSTSLLLPDATVLTAGGTTPGLDDEALTGEIYRPAYLYDESVQKSQVTNKGLVRMDKSATRGRANARRS